MGWTLGCGQFEFSGAFCRLRFSNAHAIKMPANPVRETIPLADVLERVITSATLRGAIRSKLRTGASREMISFLIGAYAPAGLRSDRTDGRAPRLAVELIPHRGRTAFLAALSDLPNRRPVARSSRRTVARRSLASWLTKGLLTTAENLRPVEVDRRNPS
jgi:hypothetical protein